MNRHVNAIAGRLSLMRKDGDELFDHYRHVLEKLGNEKGLLALICNKSQNKFQDPSKLDPNPKPGIDWRPMKGRR